MPKKYDAATKERAVRMVQEQLPECGGVADVGVRRRRVPAGAAQGHGPWVVPP